MLASLVELQTGVQLIARRARVGAYTGSPLVRLKKSHNDGYWYIILMKDLSNLQCHLIATHCPPQRLSAQRGSKWTNIVDASFVRLVDGQSAISGGAMYSRHEIWSLDQKIQG